MLCKLCFKGLIFIKCKGLCKRCYKKEEYLKYKEKALAQKREYYTKNRDRILEARKSYKKREIKPKTKVCTVCSKQKTIKRWVGTRCCQCYKKRYPDLLEINRRYNETISSRYKYMLNKCAKSQLKCDITLDDYSKLLDSVCTYCSGPLNKTCVGLDRKDSSRGYTLDNTVPCCKACNEIKNKYLSYEEMKVAMKAVMQHRGEK